MKHLRTSVAEHVASREASRFIVGTIEEEDMINAVQQMMDGVHAVFCKGKRLGVSEFTSIADRLEEIVEQSRPYLFERHSRSASRIHPNGESLEILAVSQVKRQTEDNTIPLISIRASLTRKKFVVDVGETGIDIIPHLLTRAVERNVVADEGLDGVGQALVENLGLGIVWHHAYSKDLVPYQALAIPYGEGLLLGELALRGDAVIVRNMVHRDGGTSLDLPFSEYATILDDDGRPYMRRSKIMTAISLDMMTSAQVYLHAALSGFTKRYGQALEEIGRSVLWPTAQMQPNADCHAMMPALEVMTRDLAERLNDSDVQHALKVSTERRAERLQGLAA